MSDTPLTITVYPNAHIAAFVWDDFFEGYTAFRSLTGSFADYNNGELMGNLGQTSVDHRDALLLATKLNPSH